MILFNWLECSKLVMVRKPPEILQNAWRGNDRQLVRAPRHAGCITFLYGPNRKYCTYNYFNQILEKLPLEKEIVMARLYKAFISVSVSGKLQSNHTLDLY